MGQVENNQPAINVQHIVSSSHLFYSTKRENPWVEFENFYSNRNWELDKTIECHYSGSLSVEFRCRVCKVLFNSKI